MLSLVIVAIAALVIGGIATGLITHSIGTVRSDAALEVERVRHELSSTLGYIHSRIDALAAGLSAPPPVADPVTQAEADEEPAAVAEEAPAAAGCPTCGAAPAANG